MGGSKEPMIILFCSECSQPIDGTYISNEDGEILCVKCYEKERETEKEGER